MSLAAGGRLTRPLPADFAQTTADVRLTAQDAAGREVSRAFAITLVGQARRK